MYSIHVAKNEEIKTSTKKSKDELQMQQSQQVAMLSNPETPMSKDDMESVIEHRAWERMEETEEEKR